ncbi:DUF1416 domain-containing protein [Actinopolymorpha singaporensis]|uniref:DUF1416 domain-containing protein n=1 Tax=Actinopolymorpha singaporensis TaxID=117157 RepID=A0A1H1LWF8_9ACTN|nr:DUF1416 domain-containing protein [Actinopolymorpha singaporensis]SDR78876.1 Protein of unknown function [Actinopolymorpha singaporensis]
MSANDGCGAPTGGAALAGVNLAKEAVIQGVVRSDAAPVSGAYVRLLDGSGEFTAEVPTDADGVFRFFAGPGTWTVRALAPRGATAEGSVQAELGKIAEVELALTPA